MIAILVIAGIIVYLGMGILVAAGFWKYSIEIANDSDMLIFILFWWVALVVLILWKPGKLLIRIIKHIAGERQ